MWLFYCLDRVRKAGDIQGLMWLYNKIELARDPGDDSATFLTSFWDDTATFDEAAYGMWLALSTLFTAVSRFTLAMLDTAKGDVP